SGTGGRTDSNASADPRARTVARTILTPVACPHDHHTGPHGSIVTSRAGPGAPPSPRHAHRTLSVARAIAVSIAAHRTTKPAVPPARALAGSDLPSHPTDQCSTRWSS